MCSLPLRVSEMLWAADTSSSSVIVACKPCMMRVRSMSMLSMLSSMSIHVIEPLFLLGHCNAAHHVICRASYHEREHSAPQYLSVHPAGDGTYTASSATVTLAVGSQATATSLTVTASMPVATQPASFAVTLNSAGTGTPALAGKTITVAYGDGSTDSGTTDANGAVTFTHTYAASGSQNVLVAYAGE